MADDNDVCVSSLMRRLKSNFVKKKQVSLEFSEKDASVYDVCCQILRSIEDPDAERVDVPHQTAVSGKPMPLQNTDEIQVQRLERQLMQARHEFNEICVRETEKSFNEHKIHKARIMEWKKKRYAEIDQKEEKWKLVADRMAAMNEKKALMTRSKIEEEWQKLIDCLPSGIQRDMLKNYDVPIRDRAELCGGLDVRDSMFSRMRHQEKEDENAKDVHWKLRHTASEVAREFRARVDMSYDASLRAIAENVVRRAKREIGKAFAYFRTVHAGIKKQQKAILATPRPDILKSVEREFASQKSKQLNRLGALM